VTVAYWKMDRTMSRGLGLDSHAKALALETGLSPRILQVGLHSTDTLSLPMTDSVTESRPKAQGESTWLTSGTARYPDLSQPFLIKHLTG
jgi:hypothetical protein